MQIHEITVMAVNAGGTAGGQFALALDTSPAPFVNAVLGGQAAFDGQGPVHNILAGGAAVWSAS